jgi:hypothetical protein
MMDKPRESISDIIKRNRKGQEVADPGDGKVRIDAYKDLLQALLGRKTCQLHALIAASHASHASPASPASCKPCRVHSQLCHNVDANEIFFFSFALS